MYIFQIISDSNTSIIANMLQMPIQLTVIKHITGIGTRRANTAISVFIYVLHTIAGSTGSIITQKFSILTLPARKSVNTRTVVAIDIV